MSRPQGVTVEEVEDIEMTHNKWDIGSLQLAPNLARDIRYGQWWTLYIFRDHLFSVATRLVLFHFEDLPMMGCNE